MKVTQLSYSMLRVKAQYENDRVEVTVELNKGDSVSDAVHEAKAICAAAIMEGKSVTRRLTFNESLDAYRARLKQG